MAPAITEELHLIVQTASFFPLSSSDRGELVQAISNAVAAHAAKRNFIVGTVALQKKVAAI